MFAKLIFTEDLPTWALFAELILAGLVVIAAGSRLTKRADTLSERLNLGAGWVGLILLATVTSLPELATSSTATALGNVDLALGGIFGSCCFNITIIVILNALMGGGSVLRGASATHVLTSSFGLLLTGLALLGIVVLDKFQGYTGIAQWIEGVWAVVIAVAYLGCMRLIYKYEKYEQHLNQIDEVEDGSTRVDDTNLPLYVDLSITTIIIVSASWWLGNIGDILSTHEIEMIGRPLGATFVGAVFLALSTSLPEIVTSVAAVRLGKIDLALGNIFGSNMFNIFVIPALKVVSVGCGQPLLIDASAGSQHLLTGLLAIVLTAIAVGGLTYKSRRKSGRRFGFVSILITVTYLSGMLLLLVDTAPTKP